MKNLEQQAVKNAVEQAVKTVLKNLTVETIEKMAQLKEALEKLDNEENNFFPKVKAGFGIFEVRFYTTAGDLFIIMNGETVRARYKDFEAEISAEYQNKAFKILKDTQARGQFINVEMLTL